MTQYGFLDGWSYAIGIRIERINEIISKLLEHNPVEIHQTTIDTSTYKGSFIVNKVYLSIDNETHLLCVQLNINCNIHVETLFEAQDYDLNEKTVNIMTNLSSYTIVQTHNGSTYNFNLNIPNMDNFSITFECDEIDSTITVQLINNVFKQFYNEKVKQNKIHIRTCNINLPIEIISYIPDYAEFSYIKDQDCLVLLFSNNGQPDFHVTRLLDNNMLPSNSDIFIHVNHDMTVGIIAAVVENKLKISMGKQQRYDGNCDLKYNLYEGSVNNIAPGRNIAYTNGNYCHFWNIDNSPSIDYSYIDVYNHRATVYLRLKIKPYCLYNGYVWTTIPFYFKINSQNDKQFILQHDKLITDFEIHGPIDLDWFPINIIMKKIINKVINDNLPIFNSDKLLATLESDDDDDKLEIHFTKIDFTDQGNFVIGLKLNFLSVKKIL